MEPIGNLIANRARKFSEALKEMKPKTEGGNFFIIPNIFSLYMIKEIRQVYGHSMSHTIPRVLMVLAQHSNKEGVSWPSLKRIMELGAITNKNTLEKAIGIMEDLMIVIRKSGGGRIPNIYQLIDGSHWRSPIRLKYQNENKGIRNDDLGVSNTDTGIIPSNKTLEQEND